jgi:gas vesicle protein
MNECCNHNHEGKFLMGLFVGGVIGALTLFFLGTKEGKRTGKMLKNKALDTVEDLEDKLDELKNKGLEITKEGEDLKEKLLSQVNENKDKITKEVATKMAETLANLEEIQEKGKQTTANIRKSIEETISKSN